MSNKDVLAYFKTEENFNDYLSIISQKLKRVCNEYYKTFNDETIGPMYYVISLNPNEPYEKDSETNMNLTVLEVPDSINELNNLSLIHI